LLERTGTDAHSNVKDLFVALWSNDIEIPGRGQGSSYMESAPHPRFRCQQLRDFEASPGQSRDQSIYLTQAYKTMIYT